MTYVASDIADVPDYRPPFAFQGSTRSDADGNLWILTTVVYSLGGRMEVGTGTSAKATLDNPKTIQALNLLKAMRWTDNSMGSNFEYSWGDINQAFAGGSIGMYISGSDVYTNLVQASNINPGIYGLATIPLAKNNAVSQQEITGARLGLQNAQRKEQLLRRIAEAALSSAKQEFEYLCRLHKTGYASPAAVAVSSVTDLPSRAAAAAAATCGVGATWPSTILTSFALPPSST